MKVCSCCKIEKSFENFCPRKNSFDGLQYFCKDCMSKAMKKRYKKNPEIIKKRNYELRQKIREEVEGIKAKLGCKFCSEKESACLDFHHTEPDKKERAVAQFVQMRNRGKALQEIEKCICVCANCHRKIHAGIIKI